MSNRRSAKNGAFGVQPGFPPYSLRQARYHALGEDVAGFVASHAVLGRPIHVLDVGTYDGVARRYIEVHAADRHIRYHAVDLSPRDEGFVYKRHDWSFYYRDLEHGLNGLESNYFDVVICEQVLEHLHNVDFATSEIIRVLRPGGMLVVGVPIFPHGVHWIRKHVIPITDRLFRVRKKRGHIQAFSKRSFLQLLHRSGDLTVQKSRGFRIVSGGMLRPLEYCRWWWKLGRWTGAILPSCCIEIQVLATKRAESVEQDCRRAA